MAKKSKTQRAKASAARVARKEQAREAEVAAIEEKDVAEANAAETVEPKKKFFGKSNKSETSATKAEDAQLQKKVIEKKPAKKSRFAFFKDVRSELRRVTWPTKQDVGRWSLVVVAALLFFGIYVTVLDNVIVTPILVLISGLGA